MLEDRTDIDRSHTVLRCGTMLRCGTIPYYGCFSLLICIWHSRLSNSMGWLRTLSINWLTMQAWKFRTFAILTILSRWWDTSTALLRCMELACQITLRLTIEIYDRKNTTIIGMFIHSILLRFAFRQRCWHAGHRRSYAACIWAQDAVDWSSGAPLTGNWGLK